MSSRNIFIICLWFFKIKKLLKLQIQNFLIKFNNNFLTSRWQVNFDPSKLICISLLTDFDSSFHSSQINFLHQSLIVSFICCFHYYNERKNFRFDNQSVAWELKKQFVIFLICNLHRLIISVSTYIYRIIECFLSTSSW